MNNRNSIYFILCCALVIVLIVLTFTPIVIPEGRYHPFFLGMPYTLWISGLVTVILVLLTYVGARIYPGKDEEEDES